MKAYFEVGMRNDGKYFFTARTSSGRLLVRSPCHLTRQAALDGIRSIVSACVGEVVPYYDTIMRSWRTVND